MPGDVEAKEMRSDLRKLVRSAPHVPPRYMLDWSNEMERKYERIAKMQLDTLQQMLALKIQVENYLNPKNFEWIRKENEDAK